MLKFETTLDKVIDEQATGRSTVKQFVEYGSKKRLLESGVLDEQMTKYIRELRNAVAFHVHKDKRYLVIVMYYSTSKSHGFYVLDMQTLKMAQAESVKMAKQGVLDLIATDSKANDKVANKNNK